MSFIDIIKIFFPEITILEEDDLYTLFDSDVKILVFSFDEQDNITIKIEELHRSNNYSGTSILDLLEIVLNEYSTKSYSIYLSDTSVIEKNGYTIPLSILHILVKGQSWYNSKGYFSRNHEKEKIQWDVIRESSMMFDDVTQEKWFSLFNININSLTYHQIGLIIYSHLKRQDIPNEMVEYYYHIILIIRNNIKYTSNLNKSVIKD